MQLHNSECSALNSSNSRRSLVVNANSFEMTSALDHMSSSSLDSSYIGGGVSLADSSIVATNATTAASSQPSDSLSPKAYVESLHQNSKSQLIYGKNNVIVNQVVHGQMTLLLNILVYICMCVFEYANRRRSRTLATCRCTSSTRAVS